MLNNQLKRKKVIASTKSCRNCHSKSPKKLFGESASNVVYLEREILQRFRAELSDWLNKKLKNKAFLTATVR